MKKSTKEYVVQRICRIFERRKKECACEPPRLKDHIRLAVVKGTATLKPKKDITEKVADMIINDRYLDIKIEDIFAQPQSYKDEMKEYRAGIAKTKKEHHRLDKLQAAIIDKVNLDRFEEGEEAIKEALTTK